MQNYKIDVKKGQGTYSNVFLAHSLLKNQRCAIKIMKNKYENIDKLKKDKEIQALKMLNHPNIIKMIDVLYDENQKKLAIVFQLMDCNLYQYYKLKKTQITIERIKSIGHQILDAVCYIHNKGIFHRDIKPQNILVSGDRIFKLADFGSSKSIRSSLPYTEYISTRWYRAPECLLTDGYYSQKMDVWSVGCILFELYTHYPLFPGDSIIEQVSMIFTMLGHPSQNTIEKFRQKPPHLKLDFKKTPGVGIRSLMEQAPPELLDLLENMLKIDPDERIQAKQALNHNFFYALTERKKYQKAIIDKIVQNKEVSFPSLKKSQSKQKKINVNIQ